MLFYPQYYDIIRLWSLKIIQAFYLLLGFAENQGVFWDFRIQNSVQITEGSDNGDLDNRGSTVNDYGSYTANLAWLQPNRRDSQWVNYFKLVILKDLDRFS